MPLIVEGRIPAEVISRYLHGLGQILCVHHEQGTPCFRIVVPQSGSILTAQGVDDGPHISVMGFQLGHGCVEVYRGSGAEQAVGPAALHTGAGGNVGQVSALRIYFVEVCIQRHGDEG